MTITGFCTAEKEEELRKWLTKKKHELLHNIC